MVEKFRELWKNGFIEPFELQYRKKDHNLAWIRVRSSLVKIEIETYIQLIIEDIEKEKQAEKIIKEEIRKLKELDQMKEDLITRASHELKTPLVLIYGATEFLLNHYKKHLDDDVVEFIEMIKKGGTRLKNLITNLIDVSRIESHKLVVKTQTENIIKILKDCIKDIKFLANKRNLQIGSDFPEACYIDINKERIEQGLEVQEKIHDLENH